MFCGQCGSPNPDTASFCSNCGSPLAVSPAPQPVAQPAPQPVAQPEPQPVAQPAPQPVAQPEPQPIAQPAPQPVAQPMPQVNPYSAQTPYQANPYSAQTPYQTNPYSAQNPYQPTAPNQVPQQPAAGEAPKKKKKLLPWIIAGAVLLVAIGVVLFLVLGGGSNSSPENAALDFVEGLYEGDFDQVCDAVYPELIDDDLEEYFDEVSVEMEYYEVEYSDFTVTDTEYGDRYDCEEMEEYIYDYFDKKVEVSQICWVEVSYNYEFWGYEYSDDYEVCVAEIDGNWYIVGS